MGVTAAPPCGGAAENGREQMSGRMQGRQKAGMSQKVGHVPLWRICPSPENDRLYRPVVPADPEIVALADSILARGILEPLVITADHYIVSGHRRYAAAKLAGLKTVPCYVVPVRRSDDLDGFVQLLREHNRQRDKTNAEKLREELVSINPEQAHAELWQYRRARAALEAQPLAIGVYKPRKTISAARALLLAAVLTILNDRRAYWPLSVRQIHYALLNDPPLKHASKADSTYRNDSASYKTLTDLVARGRLDGSIPFEALGDETRPVEVWDVHQNPRAFVRRELANMFCGYWRDLMQSQPNHIELLGEKNTITPILKPPASEYTITLTTGRGYCSLPPRYAMAKRFEASGKEKLILLIVSDFDPDGEEIAHSFVRSMRDDFRIDRIHAIKVALTAEQVRQFELAPGGKAKKTSSNYASFVNQHGTDIFELEALEPEVLQQIVREAIESVIDRDALSAEIDAERADAAFLASVRQRVCESLAWMSLEDTCDDV